MTFRPLITATLLLAFAALLRTAGAVAIDQAKPTGELPAGHPPLNSTAADAMRAEQEAEIQKLRAQDRTAFQAQVQLDQFRLLAIHHADHVKILDSWARQSLEKMLHKSSFNGQDPLYTVLDMAFRPEMWRDQNILYIQAIPIRQQLAALVTEEAEQKRILQKATISPAFFNRRDVQGALMHIAEDSRLAPAVDRLAEAEMIFDSLQDTLLMLPPGPPVTHQPWQHLMAIQANIPERAKQLAALGAKLPEIKNYSPQASLKIWLAIQQLFAGWRYNEIETTNAGIAGLVAVLPTLNPDEYPSPGTRSLELYYNRTFKGTLVAIVYFAANILFLIAAVGAAPRARRYAMGLFTLAVVCHVLAMGVRWWLAGRIPIQNQFESVLGAALLGCLIGWGLELWKKNNLFGMAMSFVGFLAMTACYVVPYVFGKSIGENIGKVAGVLVDYWLYIHVNIVICSYALIAASFVLGTVYLLFKYVFVPRESPALAVAGGGEVAGGGNTGGNAGGSLLEQLDAANTVVLQMAFWFLGIGIICGAIWADHSWGRPWGWDPKETFALVTWLVYLIIIHLRFVVPGNRATWTAVLSIVGFAIMMFNWIGVNFFLAGLHSYA